MEKKPEASGEELEQLGPYQLHEQVPQDELSRGELYRATHETSGATALVFKPAEEDGAVPLRDWRVRCVSSASPGYVALEAEDSRWAVAPDKHSVEALMCLFEEVREGVRRMADAFPASDEPRPWRRLGLALAGATAVGALVFALLRVAPASQLPAARSPWRAPYQHPRATRGRRTAGFRSRSTSGSRTPHPRKGNPCSPGPCRANLSRGKSAPVLPATRRSSWWAPAGGLTTQGPVPEGPSSSIKASVTPPSSAPRRRHSRSSSE